MHSPSATTASHNSRRSQLIGVAVCAFVAVIYLPTLRFEFVYDDRLQILNNPLLKDWHNWFWLVRTDVWSFWNPLRIGNYWRPLFMLWLLLNRILFGFNPVGWHAMAVAAHVFCVYWTYRLFLKLSDDTVVSGLAALIFAIHPTRLETAAWVSGATDSLAGCFMIPSLICFINGWNESSRRRWFWWIASASLYGGALLVKETAAITPVLAFAYVLFCGRRQRWIRDAAISMLPFSSVAVAYLVARGLVLHGLGHSLSPVPVSYALYSVPWLLWFYVRHLVWPLGLGVFYEVPLVKTPASHDFWLPLLALICVTVACGLLVRRARNPLLLFASVWIWLPLVPVLYIPFLGTDNFVNDRYLYFPCVGFALIVSLLLRRVRVGAEGPFGIPRLQFLLAIALVAGLTTATFAQQVYWANDLLLFRRGIETAPGSAAAYINFGTALADRGYKQESRFAFEQVLVRKPNNWSALYDLGLSFFMDGNFSKAEAYLQRAVNAAPTESDAAALLAEAQVRQHEYEPAEANIRRAIALRPYQPGYRRVLALSLEGQGRIDEALKAVETEARNRKDEPELQQLVARLEKAKSDSQADKKSHR